jgi:predicted choloylglycine hydrolase
MRPRQRIALPLPTLDFSGAPRDCGEAYGEGERESILGFFSSQIKLTAANLNYASKCWLCLQQQLPEIAEFCLGLSKGADLTLPQVALLLLHEEVIHAEHCSIVGVSRTASKKGQSVIAQNWDWPATVYSWPKIVRMKMGSLPATLTYSFPGLWACAGINEAGLAIGWSGAGYWPSVLPAVGVPTYALLAGLLTKSSLEEAVTLMERRCHAGCFIFFITDATGELAIIEAWPGDFVIHRNEQIGVRTNHYLSREAIQATKQVDPRTVSGATTVQRYESLKSNIAFDSQCDVHTLQSLLRHPGICAAYKLEEAYGGYISMTIDSICLQPDKLEISVARGLPERHDFIAYSLEAV